MQFGNWNFTPSIFLSAVAIVVFTLFISLGFWQLDRAGQKQDLRTEVINRQTAVEIDINQPKTARLDKDAMKWRRVRATGAYDDELQILLDNQVVNSRVGYFVYTPFKLDGEPVWALVNRGWVATGKDRSVIPDIAVNNGRHDLTGVAKPFPLPGLILGEQIVENMGGNIYRLPNMEPELVNKIVNQNLLPYVIRLDQESHYGFKREWRLPGSKRNMHLGYAFQWFLLAATLLVIYIAVNLRKIKNVTRENDD